PWMVRSSSPVISPSMRIELPITVFATSLSYSPSNARRKFDVHFDVALKAGAVLDDHLRRLDVTNDDRRRFDRRARRRIDVARELTPDRNLGAFDVSNDAPRLFDGHVILQVHFSFDSAFDCEIPRARKRATYLDPLADDTGCFARHARSLPARGRAATN